jgi:hypothetical protein
MQATIADIRRGDRFTRLTGRGGTYIALRAAKDAHGARGPKSRVIVVDDQNDQPGPDGVIDLGNQADRKAHIIDPPSDTPVEIHERGLNLHHESDDPLPFTDTPNPHLANKTDRESEADRLREHIPNVVGQIANLGSERDVLIKQALAAGVSVIELAGLTGLSRARIYQIRDGRR